jgi:hypothetical protein
VKKGFDKDNVIRILTTGTVISSAAFGKLPATQQTAVLAEAMSVDKPFVFVDNFRQLADLKRLAQRLIDGEDVEMELDFNKIELEDDERTGLKMVRPLFARLKEMKPTISGYEWSSDSEIKDAGNRGTYFYNMTGYKDRQYDPTGNYSLTKAVIKKIWDAWVIFYTTGEQTMTEIQVPSYGKAAITMDTEKGVSIGCKTFPKAALDAVAKHFKFTTGEDDE